MAYDDRLPHTKFQYASSNIHEDIAKMKISLFGLLNRKLKFRSIFFHNFIPGPQIWHYAKFELFLFGRYKDIDVESYKHIFSIFQGQIQGQGHSQGHMSNPLIM